MSTDDPMPLVAHLRELRDRFRNTLIAVFVAFLGLFPFANELYTYVSEPLRSLLPEGSSMIATEVTSPFLTPFKLSVVLAVFVAMPVILAQLWGFIAPGLYKSEKRIVIPLLTSSVVLFYVGVAFAYYVVFPLLFGFFTTVGPGDISVMTDINRYLDFVLKIFFAFGLAFEVPVAAVILILTGVVTADQLANNRSHVIVGCFVMGMLLTPPDVISQTLLALPMWLLFEVGLAMGRVLSTSANEDE